MVNDDDDGGWRWWMVDGDGEGGMARVDGEGGYLDGSRGSRLGQRQHRAL